MCDATVKSHIFNSNKEGGFFVLTDPLLGQTHSDSIHPGSRCCCWDLHQTGAVPIHPQSLNETSPEADI